MASRSLIQTICAAGLLLLLAISHLANGEKTVNMSPNLNANVNLNLDVLAIGQAIKAAIGASASGDGFVKGVLERVKHQIEDKSLNVMVYNLNQEYSDNLLSKGFFETITRGDRTYGIWVFKCGTFMNKGERGWQNWAFSGDYQRFAGGAGVIFWHPDCSKPAYRPGNYIKFDHRDYYQPGLRDFHNIESVEECYAWALEIDANKAIYDADNRRCVAKEKYLTHGVLYDGHGAKLGNYDVHYADRAETTDQAVRDSWFRTGECDAVHSRDGHHWCKRFPERQNRYLILRRE